MSCVPFPMLTKQDIADFSGRPVASYGPYADTALKQATLLFKLGTCLTNLPEDEVKQELATTGILAMADQIFLEQQYAKAKASPFSSESIGSYSYSKKTQQNIQQKQETGVMFFDMALHELSECDQRGGATMSGGIEVFNNDSNLTAPLNGYSEFIGPDDVNGYWGPQGTGSGVTW